MFNYLRSKACVLSFTGGFVDVVGFAALFGLFANHMTGNIVMIGVSLSYSSPGMALKLLAIPTFIGSIALMRLLVLRLHTHGCELTRILCLTQAALLVLAMVAAIASLPHHDPNDPLLIAAGLFAVAAMSVQNTQDKLVHTGCAPTTVMTGNLVQAVIDFVDLYLAKSNATLETRQRLKQSTAAIACFIAGAVLGALMLKHFSFACLALPILLLLAMGLMPAMVPLENQRMRIEMK
ncbi:DUF1275 domain-containing protein [Methylobacillus flagellatus]|uniref:YoaK family protein n=1 Tax=Methylobacillus flagellatus TaxID=405 RepID=UPI002853A5CB|nr:YoaK family protein [Methylobacillus flagellatus]MDR5171944.1 DUF1275 domain-containing protein [Methylobacillus flagellatus]